MDTRPGTPTTSLAKRRLAALVAAWFLCTLAFGAPNSGRCVTAAVPWPFTLPDGSVIPAGTLTLCLSRVHDPVTGMHELRSDGSPFGLYLSRLGEAEGSVETPPVVVFAVSASGSHRLLGYTLPLGDTLHTFRFYDPRAGKAERLAARGPLLAPAEPDGTVLVAAAPGSTVSR